MSEVMIDADLRRAADISATNLKETAEALQLVIEGIELESRTPAKSTDDERVRAVVLVNRIPMYLATLNVILRDIEAQADDIIKAVEESSDKQRQEKEGAA